MKAKRHPKILFLCQYYTENLHRGVAQFALENGWHLNAATSRGYSVPRFEWDGIVSSILGDKDGDRWILPFKGKPTVSLTRRDNLPSVFSDHEAVGKIGAEHLIELGYPNFAFYFKVTDWHEKTRFKGFNTVLQATGHKCSLINHSENPRKRWQPAEIRTRKLRRALRALPKPVAIMAPFDCLAVEILDTCLDIGIQVPAEVGILGVNNDELICNFTVPSLSSIDNDEFQIGYQGASLLKRILDGKEVSNNEKIVIEPKAIITRRSTDLLDLADVPDPAVFKAMRGEDRDLVFIQVRHCCLSKKISRGESMTIPTFGPS